MKPFALCVALSMAALTLTPVAHADMLVGNYRLDTDRDPGHRWLWSVRPCVTNEPACRHIQAIPQPNGQAAAYYGDARLVNGRYIMAVDVPDGVRCTVQFFPSHDVYSWDANTLQGSVDSSFDTGCGGAPGGTDSWPFTLARW